MDGVEGLTTQEDGRSIRGAPEGIKAEDQHPLAVNHQPKPASENHLDPDSVLLVPNAFLEANYDLDEVVSKGLFITVNQLGMSTPQTEPEVHHAQVDVKEQPHGSYQYCIVNMKHLCASYKGWQVKEWQKTGNLAAQLSLACDGTGAALPGGLPAAEPGACTAALQHTPASIPASGTNAAMVPIDKVTIQPLEKLSIPRAFLEHNFDAQSLLLDGLRIEIVADGQVDPQHYDVRLQKYVSPQASVQYKVIGLADACQLYQGWTVLQWEKLDDHSLKLSLAPPPPVAVADISNQPPAAAEPAAPMAVSGSSQHHGSTAQQDAAAPPAAAYASRRQWQQRQAEQREQDAAADKQQQQQQRRQDAAAATAAAAVLAEQRQLSSRSSRSHRSVQRRASNKANQGDLDGAGAAASRFAASAGGSTGAASNKRPRHAPLAFIEHSAPPTKSKAYLHPRVKLIMPRQFVEKTMDKEHALTHGLTVQVDAEGRIDPIEHHITLEQFRHAQGYSQYKVLGLGDLCTSYANWRVEAWERVDQDTVRLKLGRPPGHSVDAEHKSSKQTAADEAHKMTQGSNAASAPAAIPERHLQPSQQLENPPPQASALPMFPVFNLTATQTAPRVHVLLKQGQAINLPRQFVEANFNVEQIVAHGMYIQVQPQGSPALEPIHVHIVRYQNEKGWAQYRVPHDLKATSKQYPGWGIAAWEKVDDITARITIVQPSQAEQRPAASKDLAGAAAPLPHRQASMGLRNKQHDPAAPAEQAQHKQHMQQIRHTRPSQQRQQQQGLPQGHAHGDDPEQHKQVFLSGQEAEDDPADDAVGAADSEAGVEALQHLKLSASPASTAHKNKKPVTLMSPDHFIHIPRHFFQDNFDVAQVLESGLHVQVEADGVVDPEAVVVTVANYQNNSGYSYYRLLGWKHTCRKYNNWRVEGWDKVDSVTVRLRLAAPQPGLGNGHSTADKDGKGDGSYPVMEHPTHPPTVLEPQPAAQPPPAAPEPQPSVPTHARPVRKVALQTTAAGGSVAAAAARLAIPSPTAPVPRPSRLPRHPPSLLPSSIAGDSHNSQPGYEGNDAEAYIGIAPGKPWKSQQQQQQQQQEEETEQPAYVQPAVATNNIPLLSRTSQRKRRMQPSAAQYDSSQVMQKVIQRGLVDAACCHGLDNADFQTVQLKAPWLVRQEKRRAYIAKQFFMDNFGATDCPVSLDLWACADGHLDDEAYVAKVSLNAKHNTGRHEYLVHLPAPLKAKFLGCSIVGWSRLRNNLLLVHLMSPSYSAGKVLQRSSSSRHGGETLALARHNPEVKLPAPCKAAAMGVETDDAGDAGLEDAHHGLMMMMELANAAEAAAQQVSSDDEGFQPTSPARKRAHMASGDGSDVGQGPYGSSQGHHGNAHLPGEFANTASIASSNDRGNLTTELEVESSEQPSSAAAAAAPTISHGMAVSNAAGQHHSGPLRGSFCVARAADRSSSRQAAADYVEGAQMLPVSRGSSGSSGRPSMALSAMHTGLPVPPIHTAAAAAQQLVGNAGTATGKPTAGLQQAVASTAADAPSSQPVSGSYEGQGQDAAVQSQEPSHVPADVADTVMAPAGAALGSSMACDEAAANTTHPASQGQAGAKVAAGMPLEGSAKQASALPEAHVLADEVLPEEEDAATATAAAAAGAAADGHLAAATAAAARNWHGMRPGRPAAASGLPGPMVLGSEGMAHILSQLPPGALVMPMGRLVPCSRGPPSQQPRGPEALQQHQHQQRQPHQQQSQHSYHQQQLLQHEAMIRRASLLQHLQHRNIQQQQQHHHHHHHQHPQHPNLQASIQQQLQQHHQHQQFQQLPSEHHVPGAAAGAAAPAAHAGLLQGQFPDQSPFSRLQQHSRKQQGNRASADAAAIDSSNCHRGHPGAKFQEEGDYFVHQHAQMCKQDLISSVPGSLHAQEQGPWFATKGPRGELIRLLPYPGQQHSDTADQFGHENHIQQHQLALQQHKQQVLHQQQHTRQQQLLLERRQRQQQQQQQQQPQHVGQEQLQLHQYVDRFQLQQQQQQLSQLMGSHQSQVSDAAHSGSKQFSQPMLLSSLQSQQQQQQQHQQRQQEQQQQPQIQHAEEQ